MEIMKLGEIRFRKAYEVANKEHLKNFGVLEIAFAIDAVEKKENTVVWKDWNEIKIIKKIEELDKYYSN